MKRGIGSLRVHTIVGISKPRLRPTLIECGAKGLLGRFKAFLIDHKAIADLLLGELQIREVV